MGYYNETKKQKLPKSNRQISATSVRLIDENGTMLDVAPISVALEKANTAGLDLVEISPKAEPPVCKIMDFGKYKYEIKRSLQRAKKKQKVVTTKEIRVRPAIGEHDLDIKVNQVRRFISKGNKVKIVLRFKGRETSYHEVGASIIEKILEKTSDVATPENPPDKGLRLITVTLASNENSS